jgi:hypothetical protein
MYVCACVCVCLSSIFIHGLFANGTLVVVGTLPRFIDNARFNIWPFTDIIKCTHTYIYNMRI